MFFSFVLVLNFRFHSAWWDFPPTTLTLGMGLKDWRTSFACFKMIIVSWRFSRKSKDYLLFWGGRSIPTLSIAQTSISFAVSPSYLYHVEILEKCGLGHELNFFEAQNTSLHSILYQMERVSLHSILYQMKRVSESNATWKTQEDLLQCEDNVRLFKVDKWESCQP